MSPSARDPAAPARFLRQFLAAFAALTLWAGGFIGMLFADVNRQAFLWDRSDTATLFAGLALAALVAAALVRLLDRLTRGAFSRVAGHFVFLLVALAVSQLLPPRYLQRLAPDDLVYAVLVALGLGLSLFSLRRPRNRVRPALWSLLEMLALVPVLLAFNLLRFPPLHRSADFPLPRRSAAPDKPPVVVFSFDSVAWIACMEPDGRVRADLPNLRRFQEACLDFTQALSPGFCTTISTPNLFLQRDPAAFSRPTWSDSFLAEDVHAFTNGLFFAAKQADYRTALVGIYLPYKQWLDGLLDQATIYPFEAYFTGRGLPDRFRNLLYCMVRYFRGPFPERWAEYTPHLRGVARAHDRYYAEVNHELEKLAIDFLAHGLGPGDFFFVDIPIPHFPFVFRADGSTGPDADFESQLRYADRLFGRLLDAMQSGGHFDPAWVVFTSDHGEDNIPNREKNHVPLLIKLPAGTLPPRQINEPVRMWEMGPFFHGIFQGLGPAESLERFTKTKIDFD